MTDQPDDPFAAADDPNADREDLLRGIIRSSKAVHDRLDEERYWRTENEKRKTRSNWSLVGAVVALVLVLGGIVVIVLDNRDTADSIETYQQTVSSQRGERIEGGVLGLLCALYPSVHPEFFEGTTQEQRSRFLGDCVAANDVSVDALIEVPQEILPTKETP